MNARVGRPPKECPRNISLNLRVTQKEAALIRSCAERMKTTRTEAIVQAVRQLDAALRQQEGVL